MNKFSVHKITRLALLLAFGIVISYFESFIPIPIPGVKLGIANVIGLVVLYFFGLKEYYLIGLLRVLIVGLLRGSPVSLLFSFTGWICASLIVTLFYLTKKGSIYGLSIASAVMHSVGQIVVSLILYQTTILIYYLPVILLTSIASAIIVALLTSLVLSRIEKVIQ